MAFQSSDQDIFATNLSGQSRGGTAIYHPLEFRPHWGRVGDIAYFDSEGRYVWIHNAFHTQDLQRLGWPEFTANESAVVTETLHHYGCRLAVGGSVRMTKEIFEVDGKATLEGAKVDTGGRFSLEVSEEGGSMSVLVLDDDPLKYRRCEGEYFYDLIDWFSCVEMHAWARVDAYHERPKKIFLVLGQDLTTSYAITHKKQRSFKCEVILEANVGIPSVVESKLLGSYGIVKAYASVGFEDVVKKSTDTTNPTEYTVFLHTYSPKSGPLQRFKQPLKARVEEQYRFFLHKGRNIKYTSKSQGIRFVKFPNSDDSSQNPRPQKVPMEFGEHCQWYMVKIGNEFGVQYCGDRTDDFMPELNDEELIRIVVTLREKMYNDDILGIIGTTNMLSGTSNQDPHQGRWDDNVVRNIFNDHLVCGICNNILIDPVTLQCGNTLCHTCLQNSFEIEPPPYENPNLGNNHIVSEALTKSDPLSEGKRRISPTMQPRFKCPFQCSQKYHSRKLYSSNWTLQNILNSMPQQVFCDDPEIPPSQSLEGTFAKIFSELDCQICYLLLHDPITNPCGHTFCRTCLLRTLDHTTHPVCPICRCPIPQFSLRNIIINKLISSLFPAAAAEQAAREALERHKLSSGINTPIFVCTLAFPGVTCFLHIFEPRYRLMLRRCMAGDRKFGMVLPRRIGATRYLEETLQMTYHGPATDEGGLEHPADQRTIFMRFGTMLEIRESQMLPDGRILIEAIGRERFCISEWAIRDGYIVARTTSLPDPEPRIYIPPPNDVMYGLTASVMATKNLDLFSTNELIYLTRRFIESLRRVATIGRLLSDNEIGEQLAKLDSRGDAVQFAWWAGSKMPVIEEEAYGLLLQSGTRELYCVLGRWIGELERQSW